MPEVSLSHPIVQVFAKQFIVSQYTDYKDIASRRNRLLRALLGFETGLDSQLIEFKRSEMGKPEICGASRKFSVSHSGPWFVVAIANFEIGVDVETRTPRVDSLLLAKRFFHPADTSRLKLSAALQRPGDFQRQWVAKEAALKAAGTGIARHLHLVQCEFDGGRIKGVNGPDGRFVIHPFTLEDETPGAVAWLESIPATVTLCKWPERAG